MGWSAGKIFLANCELIQAHSKNAIFHTQHQPLLFPSKHAIINNFSAAHIFLSCGISSQFKNDINLAHIVS